MPVPIVRSPWNALIPKLSTRLRSRDTSRLESVARLYVASPRSNVIGLTVKLSGRSGRRYAGIMLRTLFKAEAGVSPVISARTFVARSNCCLMLRPVASPVTFVYFVASLLKALLVFIIL